MLGEEPQAIHQRLLREGASGFSRDEPPDRLFQCRGGGGVSPQQIVTGAYQYCRLCMWKTVITEEVTNLRGSDSGHGDLGRGQGVVKLCECTIHI